MDSGMFGKALGRIFAALVLVLLVAGVARAAYMLLAPLVPALVSLVVLGVIYWVIFRGIRR
ncbi:hypothetical protein [Streptomyces broussonetiae]|uniref:Uncharacterized protein n=1 Tax=Streptomyces broussonetiae TaxID=2686304 RepID=A0ABV5EJW2_9ACTN